MSERKESMAIIRGEEDLNNLRIHELSAEDLELLPAGLREVIEQLRRDQEKVGWGFRVFRNKDNGLIITTPLKDGWFEDGGDLQVNVFDTELNTEHSTP